MPVIPSTDHILVSDYLAARDATQESRVPVGAMVGGLAGGAALALLCTACWLLWARTTRRAKEKHKRDADALHKTKSNTRYNASAALATPWLAATYRPMLLRPAKTKVKFMEKGDKSQTPSAPKPLRSAKAQAAQALLADAPTTRGVPRLPSTVSSVSLYSAESAEEHQMRVPTSLILAALGSVEAALTRGSWGDRRGGYRASEATSGSAYSQDMGVAY
ncbi:hypothetical protein DFH06DRAFT_1313211 [Mycena polygramma]|nr:hypothetical protein DFH06DRAFT_1313211 [Mycena polygramma]